MPSMVCHASTCRNGCAQLHETLAMFYSEISMVVVECEFEGWLWNQIWNRVKNYLDKPRPQLLQRIKEVNLELKNELDFYCLMETHALGEFPSICGSYGPVPRPGDAFPI